MPPDPKHCFPLLVAQLLRALSAAMSSAGETNSSHASWTSGIWKPKTILPHQSMECLLPVPAPPCLRLGPLPPGSYFYTFAELYPVHLPLPGAHCSSTEAFSYSETDSHTELLKSVRRKRNHLDSFDEPSFSRSMCPISPFAILPGKQSLWPPSRILSRPCVC